MLLSATEFATAAMMRPTARKASTPTDNKINKEIGRSGSGIFQIACASPIIRMRLGR